MASSPENINGPNDWRRRGLSVGLTSKKTPIPLPTRHATAWLGSEERSEGTEAWQESGHMLCTNGPPSEAFLKRKCKWYFPEMTKCSDILILKASTRISSLETGSRPHWSSTREVTEQTRFAFHSRLHPLV